ncbi:Glycoside hydrolase family 17 [Dillenia turbinata]|uniref:Glycoside hydrolase family 17 n=1 Tax=Dillenia turbinata TaxID=194707 RepID=A0AAN8ZE82_9MAGN
MRLFWPDADALRALRGSNVEVILGVENEDLPWIALSQTTANTWVQNNVKNYPNVRIKYIAVGNEISPFNSNTRYVQVLLPTLKNIHNAIVSAGLVNQIKVSTPIETGLLGDSYLPSKDAFRTYAQGFINPIIHFLVSIKSPLLANVYPYFAYGQNTCQNLFDVMLDSIYAAFEKSGGGSLQIVVMTESGWHSTGGTTTTIDNARTCNNILIQHVKKGLQEGLGACRDIFAMFNENKKSQELEKGLFLPNKQPKYPINLTMGPLLAWAKE